MSIARSFLASSVRGRGAPMAAAGVVLLVSLLGSCGGAPTERQEPVSTTPPGGTPGTPSVPQPPPPQPPRPTWDVAARGVPQLIEASYIDVARIEKVTRFRSGHGHDYSDDYERCRSMKHYFQPAGPGAGWGNVAVFAPVTGRVTRLFPEWAGSQVQITSSAYPAFTVILFHVGLARALAEGDSVTAGEQLGTHVSGLTSSDVAVLAMTPGGRAFVSYMEALPDALFATYVSRGATSRQQFVVSKSEREATPLVCNGEAFVGPDQLPVWVELR